MTEEEKDKQEEQCWFINVQKKLRKRIANPKWDSLNLTSAEWDTVIFIAKATNVNELPLLINERITDRLLKKIDTQFKQMKGKEV